MVLRKSRNSLLLYWQKRHLGNLKKLLKLYGHLRRQSPARPRKHYEQAQARRPFCLCFFFLAVDKSKNRFSAATFSLTRLALSGAVVIDRFT